MASGTNKLIERIANYLRPISSRIVSFCHLLSQCVCLLLWLDRKYINLIGHTDTFSGRGTKARSETANETCAKEENWGRNERQAEKKETIRQRQWPMQSNSLMDESENEHKLIVPVLSGARTNLLLATR